MSGSSRREPDGLSLIEVSLTLALIGIVAVLALPWLGKTMGRATARAGARELVSTLHAQRHRAIATSRNHGLWFSVGTCRATD